MRYIVRSVDGDEYGPFNRRELLDLVRDRRLGPGDFVRRESGRTWSPFERIAGLADAEPEAAGGSRIEPAAEILCDEDESTARSDGTIEAESTTAPPGSDDPEETLPELRDPVRSDPMPNPFHGVGLPIELGVDEEVRFVLRQSFLDSLRESPMGAVLGHRSTMICTETRVAVVRPSITRPAMSIVWLSTAGGATIETRRRLIRMIIGLIFMMQAFSLLVSGPIAGALTALIPGGDAATAATLGGFGILAGTILGLLGLLLLLTSSARSLVVASSNAEAVLGCSNAGPWHLAQIDRARSGLDGGSNDGAR